jgi:SAM-dependent methyltransferase
MQPKPENVNNNYFDGYYKEIWRAVTPEGLTKAEVNFLIDYNQLLPGNKVLDLMCGYGRHALALARTGINVTAVDNLADYINEIKEIAVKEYLSVSVILADVLNLDLTELFDLAICMGNSLSFFDHDDTLKLFSGVSSHLRKKGRFITHTRMLKEIVSENIIEKTSFEAAGMQLVAESKLLTDPLRIEAETTIITPGGEKEIKKAIDYIFSLEEYETMLNETGFELHEVFSIPGKKKFTSGEPRAYIIAGKI